MLFDMSIPSEDKKLFRARLQLSQPVLRWRWQTLIGRFWETDLFVQLTRTEIKVQK